MGGGKIKNKDQLSLAEARVEAELGNSFLTKIFGELTKILALRIFAVVEFLGLKIFIALKYFRAQNLLIT